MARDHKIKNTVMVSIYRHVIARNIDSVSARNIRSHDEECSLWPQVQPDQTPVNYSLKRTRFSLLTVLIPIRNIQS